MRTSKDIRACLKERILILDGAMGTRIQSMGLQRSDFHRGQFAQWNVSLVGNNEVLNLTAPHVITQIHQAYIDAGADIIESNTFSANRISQHEYGCEQLAATFAREGARIARQAADACTERKIWVAGSIGPTSKSLTLAPDMNHPELRAVDFDEMAAAIGEQAAALIEGGADLLLLETCYDALNTKAALFAIQQLNERLGYEIPVMISATINDRSGRTLTGQTLEAFFASIAHYPILSFGLNCSFGVTDLHAFVQRLAQTLPTFISLHPNAGLPNEMGEYEELPAYTAGHLRKMAEEGLLNIAGGCCGTDENHIRAIAQALKGLPPRVPHPLDHTLCTSGLDPLLIDREHAGFLHIGERTNVAGSRKFARLIAEKKYEEALSVARQQIEGGAAVIDINMDDAMLDSRAEMQHFLRYIAGDPAVARCTLMIDSSDWNTILAGLKNAQGKCIVNSISLKNGEADFLMKARELRRLGAAVVVMAFDEEGQATTYDRKIAIAQRAYDLLTGIGFPPQDIIFDVNILSVGTGIAEHADYGKDFIRAVAWIKANLPHTKTSGGVSNLSFAFRGNNQVREAMHSVFLYHACQVGMDMAIVNAGMLQVYDEIGPRLLQAVEDVILNTDADATTRLVALADDLKQNATEAVEAQHQAVASWRSRTIEERLTYALSKGITDYLDEDIHEALAAYGGSPVRVIEEPLMQAMEHIGQLFGEGKMFLPQVVKAAKVMKEAVAILQPLLEAGSEAQTSRPVIVTATANGDVHDIGKNIVGIVLRCNGFEVHDLGVMVPNETILAAAQHLNPVLVGVSGLITPSLKEMEGLCRLFERERMHIPIIVGGATTSPVHTAVRLAPLCSCCVAHGGDASQTSVLAKRLQMDAKSTIQQVQEEQQKIREAYELHHTALTPYEQANQQAEPLHAAYEGPNLTALRSQQLPTEVPLSKVADLIDWRMFLLFWGFKGETLQQILVTPEAESVLQHGRECLQRAIQEQTIRLELLVDFQPARRSGNDLLLPDGTALPFLRSQLPSGHFRSLVDYFDSSEERPLGLFTIVARPQQVSSDEEARLMDHALCARLAEAGAAWLQKTLYGTSQAIRAAFGYASCPDHSLKRIVFDHLQAEARLGIMLTDHYSIQPSTAICGLLICHPEARYTTIGRIDREQLTDYCQRRGITLEEGERLLSKYLNYEPQIQNT